MMALPAGFANLKAMMEVAWHAANDAKTERRRQRNLSQIFLDSNRGRKGRRATRHLKDDCVSRAIERNKTWRHRLKHMNAPRRKFGMMRETASRADVSFALLGGRTDAARRAMENLKQIHAEAWHREVGRSVPAEPPPNTTPGTSGSQSRAPQATDGARESIPHPVLKTEN